MDQIRKSALIKALEANEGELALINAQALRPLTADGVFAFRMAACGNQVDRDFERFTDEALAEMAEKFAGLPVLMDHNWSARSQTARVYAAGVEGDGEEKVLVLRCYMPRTRDTEPTIAAIEAGVLRECSVALRVRSVVCSICGADQTQALCRHIGGREYDGETCHFDLSGVTDCYEVSLVAVPAQPEAGVVKGKRYGGEEAPEDEPEHPEKTEVPAPGIALALLELEKLR